MARMLTVVPAPGPSEAAVLDTVVPALRAALDGAGPVAVVPAGPPGVTSAVHAALRPGEPVEEGADLLVVTSGSSGAARAVLLPASAVRASAAATAERLGGEGTWLLALPASAVAGLQVLCRTLLAGRRPAVLADGEALASAVSRMPGDDRRYLSAVPTQLRRWLDAEPDALRRLDAVLVGGAAADPALLDRARAEGVQVVTTYGMTETAGGCVYDGVPLTGVGVRVGEGIELCGPTLALGYRCDPRATAEAFVDGWFRTRDAGRIGADGRLAVSGRLDDVLVSGGVNVAPQAVEAALRLHPDVVDAVVLGRPDAEWGQRVVAAVVPAPGAVPELGALRRWVAERLGPPAAPRELHLLDAVPLLHTGKPDRRSVARELSGGPAAAAAAGPVQRLAPSVRGGRGTGSFHGGGQGGPP